MTVDSRTLFRTLVAAAVLLLPAVHSHAADHSVSVRFGQWGPIQYTLDRADVRVATEQWIRQASANWPSPIEFEVRYFDTLEKMAEAIQKGELDVVHLDAVTFLRKQDDLGTLDPATISIRKEGVLRTHALIVGAESTYHSLLDLKGTRLAETSGPDVETVEKVWLSKQLELAGLDAPSAFFSEILWKRTFSQSVLSVFFGQSECALVPMTALRTMSDMNPQIMERTRVIMLSPGLLPHLTAFTSACSPEKRQLILEGAISMHEYVEGRHILSLFGDDRMITCQPEHLAPVAELLGIPMEVQRVGTRTP